jgi:hypothetical protein
MGKVRYVYSWRNKWVTSNAGSIDDFIKTFEDLAEQFKEWKKMGIKLNPDSGIGDDYAEFYTDDMDVAIKAHFTFYLDDDKTTEYLETDTGEDVEVPPEKLEN